MNSRILMKMLPEDERPYEKCLNSGPEALSDAELLAVVLRSGAQGISSIELARSVLELSDFEKGLTGIYHMSLEDLCSLKGIGKVKAIQILCIGELSKRIARAESRKKLNFNDPSSVADYFMEKLRHEEQEELFCLLLDTKNALLGEIMLSKGTVNQSLITPRELFIKALSFRAVNMILIHNHPSGDASPSNDDLAVTERIRKAGDLLGISLLDHIIIGDRRYTSLREKGYLII